ncbi:MAG: type II toxin-antitoxin system RelB/DinJ family antitoxin [Clostridiales bacterium]|nr:type II toxin-antitoxin system RelB/DinJ family antitoxin [Clostridiales bacterium]
MATTPTQIRIDEQLKKQSTELFNNLGLDMSGAVTMFLKQCVLRNGLPFAVEMPRYSDEVIMAMEEAKSLSKDPSAKRYKSFHDALEDLDD